MSPSIPDQHLVDGRDAANRTDQSHRSHHKAPLLADMLKSLGKPGVPAAAVPDTATAASNDLANSDMREAGAADTATDGSERTIRTLYEGPKKCQCCINWVEQYPDDLRMEIERQEQTKQKALVVRMCKNHGEGKSLVLDSVLVQSQSLKETLARVFEGYQGITPNLKKLVFRAPFHPFVYRWGNFKKVLDDQKVNDPEAAAYSQLLYEVMDAELQDKRAEIEDLLANGVITYPLLWSLFEPGERVIAKLDSNWQVLVTQNCLVNKDGKFEVHGKYIDWDGSKFGYTRGTLEICPFAGTREITSLQVYPAKFHPSLASVEAELIARGKRFRDLRGYHHMAYSGIVMYKDSWGRPVTRNTDGRVIVDAEAHFVSYPGDRHNLEALDSAAIVPQIGIKDREHVEEVSSTSHMVHSTRFMRQQAQRQAELKSLMVENKMVEPKKAEEPRDSINDLSDDQLLLCSAKVRGYSLKLKLWVIFNVVGIKPITWNDAAFPNLMLPSKYKSLVLSFVEGQITHGNAFDDVIEGKGQGVVMLLVGNPGTGKTLTAEAVADRARRPLYVLSAGELGDGSSNVENRLKLVLELTEKWNAVLLFDECDVLLQERSSSNLDHNGVVSVFLRMLEYYRGIIIMTSNRPETMDSAFQSRIHLTLRYPDLDVPAKEHIWRYFVALRRSDDVLTDEVYSRLAQLPLNGRQIKNTVKIATLLAMREKETLSLDHINSVLQATMDMEINES